MDQILSQLNNTPSLIASQYVNLLSQAKEPKLSEMSADYYARATGISKDGLIKPYLIEGSIAIIPINGTLIHNLGWSGWGYTGYDVIKNKLDFAAKDADVKGILMQFHSTGGSVFGCADTADFIAKVGAEKPVWALSQDMAFSAAQWLHSQATRRLVTQSGGLGSVGVVVAHFDYSKMYEEYGIKVSLIFDGKHKVDGNPYQKLSKEVREKIHADCIKTRLKFAEAVARGINMSVDDVLNTEADCFYGADAVDIGFGEEIANSHTILQEFAEHVAGSNSIISIGQTMNNEQEEAQANIEQQEQAAQVSATDYKLAERQRIQSIMNSTEAKGREGLANHLALNTDLDADVAKGILGASPMAATIESTVEPSAQSDAFLEAMGNESHPNLSADTSANTQLSADEQQANDILADFKMATGAK